MFTVALCLEISNLTNVVLHNIHNIQNVASGIIIYEIYNSVNLYNLWKLNNCICVEYTMTKIKHSISKLLKLG